MYKDRDQFYYCKEILQGNEFIYVFLNLFSNPSKALGENNTPWVNNDDEPEGKQHPKGEQL